MGAASHLGIDLREYDARIYTFIPSYEALLDIAASALAATVSARSPLIVDLGIDLREYDARIYTFIPSYEAKRSSCPPVTPSPPRSRCITSRHRAGDCGSSGASTGRSAAAAP